jgi:hypothetical protein
MNTRITHVAMDTHKKQHKVAMIDQQTGEIREFVVNNLAKDIVIVQRSAELLSVAVTANPTGRLI